MTSDVNDRPWLAYNAALAALAPVWGPYAAWRFTRGNSRPGRGERLGYGPKLPPADSRVWLHGASVGEMSALRPIAERLRNDRPGARMVVSTITPTGQEEARKAFGWAEQVRYFPLDTPGPVHRALKAVNATVFALVETELWPNFLHAAARRGPVVLLNGRLSDRTFATAQRVRPLYRWMLRHLEAIGVQTDLDAERMASLGAPEERVQVLGTSKFDENVPLLTEGDAERWRSLLGLGTDPVFVAGSTFPGEDEMVLAAFRAARDVSPRLRLLIVPRHVARAADVAALAERTSFRAGRRSQPLAGDEDVIVVDTYGELSALYGLAEAAFIGRSLGNTTGGQNLIQPMSHGVPVIYGPYMENFRDVAAMAERAGAARRVPDAAALAVAWRELAAQPEQRAAMGGAGRALVARSRGASQRYVDVVTAALDRARHGR